MNSNNTKTITTVGIFSALSIILYFLEFPFFSFFPPYLKIDLSDIPAILAGISAGPVAGVGVQLIKNLVHFLIKSETGGIGEIANFVTGVALLIPIAYLIKGNIKARIMAFISGGVSMVVIANLVNYFITLPLYGMPQDQLLPAIISIFIPFNIIKSIIVIAITSVLYQKTVRIIEKSFA